VTRTDRSLARKARSGGANGGRDESPYGVPPVPLSQIGRSERVYITRFPSV
jgi:hypothetical protein